MAFDRNVFKEKLTDRVRKSYEGRENTGMYKPIFIDNLPFPFLKIGNGEHTIDIVPYLSGKFDPLEKEGTPTHGLFVFEHRGVGATEGSYVCPTRNYGKRCPLCELRSKLNDSGQYTREDLRKLNTSRRGYYYVLCYDNKQEEGKGIQIIGLSHFLFEANLSAQARMPSKRGGVGFIPFADPDKGKTIYFTHKGQREATRIEGIQFLDRDYTIPDEYLKQVWDTPLDSLITIPTEAELEIVANNMAISKGVQVNVAQQPQSRGQASRHDTARRLLSKAVEKEESPPEFNDKSTGDDDDDIPF